MSSNIKNHIMDNAAYVTIDKSTDKWLLNLSNVQDVVNALAPHAFKSVGLPGSSETVSGMAKIASVDEVLAGVVNNKIVTPYTLKQRMDRPEATEAVLGVTRYATNAEAVAGTLNTRTITAQKLKHAFNTWAASEKVQGTAKIATLPAAAAGTDDTMIMTPKKVAHAISVQSPVVGVATEKSQGIVQLATIAQTNAGTAREGMAVSPWGFKNARATDVNVGTVKLSNSTEYKAGKDATVVPSIKLLHDHKGNKSGTFGIVALSATHSTTAGTALSADANVLYKTGGDTTGRITLNGKKYVLEDELGGSGAPIGSVCMSPVEPAADSGYVISDGRSLSKTKHPELFALYGYKFGGSGDNFNVMDMRGLFVRGVGKGNNIPSSGLGVGVSGGSPGAIQSQQVRKHQHVGGWGLDFFGPFGNTGYFHVGSGSHDYNNALYYTNDGSNFEVWNGGNPNPDGIIGDENRPWNISLYYIVKVK